MNDPRVPPLIRPESVEAARVFATILDLRGLHALGIPTTSTPRAAAFADDTKEIVESLLFATQLALIRNSTPIVTTPLLSHLRFWSVQYQRAVTALTDPEVAVPGVDRSFLEAAAAARLNLKGAAVVEPTKRKGRHFGAMTAAQHRDAYMAHVCDQVVEGDGYVERIRCAMLIGVAWWFTFYLRLSMAAALDELLAIKARRPYGERSREYVFRVLGVADEWKQVRDAKGKKHYRDVVASLSARKSTNAEAPATVSPSEATRS